MRLDEACYTVGALVVGFTVAPLHCCNVRELVVLNTSRGAVEMALDEIGWSV